MSPKEKLFKIFMWKVPNRLSDKYSSMELKASGEEEDLFTEDVEYDVLCREWKCKWTTDVDSISLLGAKIALDSVIDDLKELDGVQSVERIICDDCLDFKVRSIFFFFRMSRCFKLSIFLDIIEILIL